MKLPELSTTEFGLVGHPLGHSRSKELFASWHRSYENFDLPGLTPEALYRLVLLNPCLKGFNVTIPYKEKIIPLLDRLDATAEKIGAVNTVKIRRAADGRVLALEGFNTDYAGFMSCVVRMLGHDYSPLQALILGTGGASKSVAAVLDTLGIGYSFVSRSQQGDNIVRYDDLTEAMVADSLLIVNATPLGTYPDVDTCPPIPYGAVTPRHKCIDLVYNPLVTEFMKRCAARGAEVVNGLDMLECQAKASLEIWNNKDI